MCFLHRLARIEDVWLCLGCVSVPPPAATAPLVVPGSREAAEEARRAECARDGADLGRAGGGLDGAGHGARLRALPEGFLRARVLSQLALSEADRRRLRLRLLRLRLQLKLRGSVRDCGVSVRVWPPKQLQVRCQD